MSDFQLALATCAERPNLIPNDQYLYSLLPQQGMKVKAEVWNDPTVNWAQYDGILIRSIWDYHQQIASFMKWLDQLSQLDIAVANPTTILSWNAHKNYLSELGREGVAIPPTHFIAKGTDLASIDIPWSSFIIKPAVSATAFQTFKLSSETFNVQLPTLKKLIRDKDLLIQQFIPSIHEQGEYSLIFFDNQYSHAVLKTAKPGEYRVQEEFGGSYEAIEPDVSLIDFATNALAKAPHPCLYARVDLVIHDGQPMLMELELIEPELFVLTETIQKRFAKSINNYFRKE